MDRELTTGTLPDPDAPFGTTTPHIPQRVALQGPQNKFGVAPVDRRTHDGVVFDSAVEMKVWKALVQIIHPDHIHRQVAFELLPKFTAPDGEKVRAINFVSDIVLGSLPINSRSIVIDVTGMLTPDFLLKRKMFLWRYQLPLYLASGSLTSGKRKSTKRPKGGVKLSVEALVDLYRANWGDNPLTKK